MADETIKWEFIIDDKGTKTIQDFVSKSSKSVNSLSSQVKSKLGGAFKGLGSGIKAAASSLFSFKSLLIGLGSGVAIRSLSRLISGFEALSKTQEQAEAGLTAVMKSMDRFDEVRFDNIKKLASGLQSASTFGDEAILAGTKFLMTYKQINDDVMPRTMQAMVDLSALTGSDLSNSANILGKAAMGMTGELRRYGITIDEATAKSGDFNQILKEIETQISGQAKAIRETDSGKVTGLANVIDDIKEKFGAFTAAIKAKIAEEALPAVQALNDQLVYWMESGEMEKTAAKWATYMIDTAKSLLEHSKKWFDEFKSLIERWKTDIPVVIEEAYAKLDDIQKKLFAGKTLGQQWEEVKKSVSEGVSIEGPGFGGGLSGTGVIRGKIGETPGWGRITDPATGESKGFMEGAGSTSDVNQQPDKLEITDAAGRKWTMADVKPSSNSITVNLQSSGETAQDVLRVRKELEKLEKRGM